MNIQLPDGTLLPVIETGQGPVIYIPKEALGIIKHDVREAIDAEMVAAMVKVYQKAQNKPEED